MNLRLFSQRTVSFIRSHQRRFFPSPNTSRFLKERNARLVVQMKESASFYGQRLNAETPLSVGRGIFRLRINLVTNRTLSISISDAQGQDVLYEEVPVTSSALALSLNLDKALLIIEFDAASSNAQVQ
jgi:hypothetical protein